MSFWQKIPYDKRNAYLLAGALLFALLAWKLSLNSTYNLYVQNKELEQQLQQAENAPLTIRKLQAQSAQWEKMALAYTATPDEVQKLLLASVSHACAAHKVRLKELSHAGSANESGSRVESFKVQLEGSFHELLKANLQLEQELQGGRVVSVQYQKMNDRKNKRIFLQGTLYIQSIIEEAYEKD